MIGKRLAHYTVLEQIGAGGMGVVYRAHDDHLERDVALKVLPADALTDDASRRRFRKEALALSTLNHPNIATVFDFDTQEGVDFLVMELVPGETLRERLNAGPLPIEEMRQLGTQLLEGLAAAHARGVVHRDLKPENLRVTPEGRLKILDFGLATLVGPIDDTATTRTLTGQGGLRGTPPYMAPEQLRGETVDERTDLFAAGSILYEMVAGRRPFPQPPGPLLVEAILHQAPAAPRSLNPSLPESLEAVLLKALEKEPRHRFQSAREFLSHLESPGDVRIGRTRRKIWPMATAATVVLGTLAGIGVRLLWFSGGAIDSLAVLPFQNQDAGPESEYLGDGIAETIINNVSQIQAVKVIARTSAFRYKGRSVDPRAAARELNVRAVLTGYVQRHGDELIVSAELIDTSNDRHLWGQRYTSKFREILSVEEDIARRISEELRLRLSGDEKKRLTKRQTESSQAHELYLKGRHAMASGILGDLETAAGLFDQATRIDPSYALAYVGTSEVHYFKSNAHVPAREAMPRAREAALHALRLDPELGEAHAALALVTSVYDWDWTSSEAAFKRALELSPGYAQAHLWYGNLLMARGRPREALEELRRATELDPLSINTGWIALWPCFYAPPGERRYDLALDGAQRILEKEPKFFVARNTLALAYQMTGRHKEAIEMLEAAVRESGGSIEVELFLLGHEYGLAGEREKALEVLGKVTAATHVADPAFGMALLHLGLGDRDAAFAWLDRALEGRSEDLVMAGVDPRLDVIRGDPRFQSVIRRLGLDQPASHVDEDMRP